MRVLEYEREFRQGLWPRNFATAFGGAGHAFPYLYPPLAYWVTAGIVAVVGDVVVGVHASFFLSILFSAAGVACLVSRLVDDRVVGYAAAIAYVALPYRLIVVFGRSALAEAWSFVWYPLLFLALLDIVGGKRRGLVAASLIGAAIVLTHSITATFFALVVLPFTVAFGVFRCAEAVRRATLAACLALALVAWFVVPQLAYMHELWVSDPQVMWITPRHLAEQGVPPSMYFLGTPPQAGTRLWAGLTGLLLFPLAVVAGRRSVESSGHYRLGLLCVRIWLVLAAVQLAPPLLFHWAPAPLRYIQFPWRLLGISGFVSVLGCALLARALLPTARRLRWWSLTAAMLCAVATYPDMRHPPRMSDWTDAFLRGAHDTPLAWPGLTAQGEYIPRAVPREWMQTALKPASPTVQDGARLLGWTGVGEGVRVRADGPGLLTFPVFAYPFYRVVSTDSGRPAMSKTHNGFLAVQLSSGSHELYIVRRTPRWQAVGFVISAVGCLALAFLSVGKREPECQATASS